jgi:preprotein translocase subunit YajC
MLNTILLQAADGAPAGGAGWSSMIMIIALIAIFYFFMIAPQKKREKKINEFRNNLKSGDKVITIGGIYGRIREVKGDTFILEIDEGVRIKVDKSAIQMQDPSQTPAK